MAITSERVNRRSLENWITTQDWLFKLRTPFFQLGLGYVGWTAWQSVWLALASAALPTLVDLLCWRWRRRVKANIKTVDVNRCAFELVFYVPAVYAAYLLPLAAASFAPGFDHPILIQCMAATHLAILTASPAPKLTYAFPSIAVALLGFTFPALTGSHAITDVDILLIAALAVGVLLIVYVHIQADQARFRGELENEELIERQKVLLEERDKAREQAETERERAEEANRVKSAFFAMMSHEIRTPMNAVVGFSDVLAITSKDEKAKEYGGYIHDASQSLLTLLNDILDFSKIEAEKVELEQDPLVLPDLIQSMTFWRGKAIEKNITFETFENALPQDVVLADEGRLRQILSNLISNAMKFTPEGGRVELRAALAGQSSENLSVRFEVRDSGIGFTDEVAARLFQPFVQADNSVAKNFGGTGLGLAICAKLVRLMGGRIGAKGKPGEGATFWFEIPFPRHQERRKFAVHVA
ncbi:ATP-binding protein [Parvibaculum sp.]|uniref:sensor histidine kinase n=1 Tax=Parvibaculum sp. TaxID=2024848 RepID=UPI0025D7A835|nr:ATP-binding protein [Parvibaculum sp.]|tara:strand:- start:6095 stop:7507 length:1413 start_codon:yes stop_codon:yes gene_type:complete